MKTSATTIMIALLFGLVVMVLGIRGYAGILTENDATVGSNMIEFQQTMTTSLDNMSSTADGLKDQSRWKTISSGLDSTLEYIAIGWQAMDVFFGMPTQVQAIVQSIKGEITWIDETIYAVITTSVFIFIFALIIKGKKTTSEIP